MLPKVLNFHPGRCERRLTKAIYSIALASLSVYMRERESERE